MADGTNALVLYHANCRDGFTAAWLLSLHAAFEGATFRPVSYHEPRPPDGELNNKNVYVLDFSYDYEVMLEIHELASDVTVIDHHATAEGPLKRFAVDTRSMVLFDLEHSGAGLATLYLAAWRNFVVSPLVQKLAFYAEDHDLWRHQAENALEVNALWDTVPYTFQDWLDFAYHLATNGAQVVRDGALLLSYRRQLVAEAVTRARPIEIGGVGGLATNSSVLLSDVGQALAELGNFGAAYWTDRDGTTHYSLRSREDGADVGRLAKLLRGGGHTRAAGFSVKEEKRALGPWDFVPKPWEEEG